MRSKQPHQQDCKAGRAAALHCASPAFLMAEGNQFCSLSQAQLIASAPFGCSCPHLQPFQRPEIGQSQSKPSATEDTLDEACDSSYRETVWQDPLYMGMAYMPAGSVYTRPKS